MGATPTTRWQVGGHRFVVRRLEHALVRRDARMVHDPMRSRSRALAIGAVLACVGLAACAALAFIRPTDRIGDASIVVGKDSGAMYVVDGDVLHPVLGLASARLILGRADDPVTVKESELASRPRGALVGIPGAPSGLATAGPSDSIDWSVCDTVTPGARTVASTAVLIGSGPNPVAQQMDTNEALLWSEAGVSYLVYGGVRARIDLSNVAVTRALGIDGQIAGPVSAGLIEAVPEVPAVEAPLVPGSGEPTSYELGSRAVGSVITVQAGDRDRHYVALRDGIQSISAATAQLIRFANSSGRAGVDVVTPDTVATAPPSRRPLPVATFPEFPPNIVDVDENPVTCVSWRSLDADPNGTDSRPQTQLTVSVGRALPVPAGGRTVDLAQADGGGDALDTAYMAPGSGFFVQTTGLSDESTRRDSTFYLADTGVRYGVPDEDAARALGFGEPRAAPWAIVRLLAPGPALGRSEARVLHDGVEPDPNGSLLPGG